MTVVPCSRSAMIMLGGLTASAPTGVKGQTPAEVFKAVATSPSILVEDFMGGLGKIAGKMNVPSRCWKVFNGVWGSQQCNY